MMQCDEEWTKAQAWGCHPGVTPRNIQEVQVSKLGDALGIPFFINKSSGLSRHFVFIVSCIVVLFLERLSFNLLCLVFLVCFSSLDPRSRCVVLVVLFSFMSRSCDLRS